MPENHFFRIDEFVIRGRLIAGRTNQIASTDFLDFHSLVFEFICTFELLHQLRA
jgi:hypothetical protein